MIDRKSMQILRVRVTYKDGTNIVVETAVPSMGSVEDISSIIAEGLSDPIKLNGEWAYEDISSEMWEDLG